MATRDELHHLVDELPDGELDAARRFLEYLRDQNDRRQAARRTGVADFRV
jgi:hypothetical protein